MTANMAAAIPISNKTCDCNSLFTSSHFHRQSLLLFVCGSCQHIVPILPLGEQRDGLCVASLGEDAGQPVDGFSAGVIAVEAKGNFLELRILLQHPEHGVLRCAAERHIAVLPPVLGIERYEGQKIDGRFKHIEPVARPRKVKAVPGVAALKVAAVALPLGVESPLMPVTGNAVFIESDEHGVVVFLCLILGELAALVHQLLPHEGVQHLPVDAALLQKVGVDPAHIPICWRQGEGLALRFSLFLCLLINDAALAAKEPRHRLGEGNAVEALNKVDGEAALLGGMVEPLVAPHSDAVVGGESLVPSGRYQPLALPPQKLSEVDRVGPELLLVCEMNILCDDAHLLVV